MSDAGFARLHADAVDLLTAWSPTDAQQRVLRGKFLDVLQDHPDAMSRACRSGHLTSSALVMDADRTRVLLTLHPKVGRWLQLGGHNEADDPSVRAAARREAVEESGIHDVTVSVHPIRLDRHPVPCDGGMSEHFDVQYLALVPNDAREAISAESDDLRWFPLDALPRPIDASVAALIEAAVRQVNRA